MQSAQLGLKMIPKTLLLILDGYGLDEQSSHNAAKLANSPNLQRLLGRKEMAKLHASGEYVGLPSGFIGNSEVGHLNIGAGRIVLQDMPAIDAAIAKGDFFNNPVLLDLAKKIKARNGRLHLMGLLSDGGVHSHINHLIALLKFGNEQNIPTYLHAFLDGRDTAPSSGIEFVRQIIVELEKYGAKFASISGRYYPMDRDKRWERVERAWQAMVLGKGEICENSNYCSDPITMLEKNYQAEIYDEFIKPHLLLPPKENGENEACINDNDGIFFFNFRADRARQLVHSFIDEDFSHFDRIKVPKLSGIASMTSYEENLPFEAAFTKSNVKNTIGEVLAIDGYKQLRIAETEKYAHVTYFFNGGREEAFENEERILVQSPKDVATYDLKPEMSAFEVTEKLITAIKSQKYDFIVCNLANTDMVGHTGKLEAAIKACEVVDQCVGKIEQATLEAGAYFCLTADHGNVEEMLDQNGEPHTAHTMNLTPFIIEHKNSFIRLKPEGKLGDIAPTLLSLWNKNIPTSMNGENLLITN